MAKASKNNGATIETPVTPETTAPRVEIIGITAERSEHDTLVKLYNDARAERGRVVKRGESVEKTGRGNAKDGKVRGGQSFVSYCDTNEELRAFDLCNAIESYAAACVAIHALTGFDVRHADAPHIHAKAFKAREFKKGA